MLELIVSGGPGMIPILICSVLAFGIIVERLWTLRRKAIVPPGLGEEVRGWAAQRKLDPVHLEALGRTSALGSVLAGALTVRHLGREAIRERVEDVGRHVVHDMEKFLVTLGTIALISPLLGLMGTVFGLIRMFLAVMVHGIGDAQHMAGGIGEALVCTAAGLVVAVPAYVMHRLLRGRIQGFAVEIEKEVIRLVDELDHQAAQPHAPTHAPTRRASR